MNTNAAMNIDMSDGSVQGTEATIVVLCDVTSVDRLQSSLYLNSLADPSQNSSNIKAKHRERG